MHELFIILWLYLPTGIANMGPVIADNISFLKKYTQPLDFHKTFRGKRIFGSHKTIRGIMAGTIFGILVALIQLFLSNVTDFFTRFSYGVDYTSPKILLMGACLGFGAMAGDAIKSFFKRQANVAPGKSWVPFDQLDFVLGGLVASLPFFVLPTSYYIFGLLLTLFLHPALNIVAWLLRLQDKPF